MNTVDMELYKSVFTIRQSENAIKQHYFDDEMRTPMHMSSGEEGLVAGVCGALEPEDSVFGTYRSHALFLAKTGDIASFFAEMYGKETGCNKGISGSMHLSYPEKGLALCSAIVASNIPVAMGAAFAQKYKDTGRIVGVFFGDGATDEGVFWESVNAACLMKLPIIFICQDNGIAVHTHKHHRQGHEGLERVLERFNINIRTSDSTDAGVICGIAGDLIREMRENGRPGFLCAQYYRYLEHVGVNEDFHDNYRCKKEYESWLQRDPVDVLRARLLAEGVDEESLVRIEREILMAVNDAVVEAKRAPFLAECEVFKGVYSCE